jgi:hypothetical protein
MWGQSDNDNKKESFVVTVTENTDSGARGMVRTMVVRPRNGLQTQRPGRVALSV